MFFFKCPLTVQKQNQSQVLQPNLQFLWFILVLYTFLLWFIYYKRFNTGLALDYQPPVTLYFQLALRSCRYNFILSEHLWKPAERYKHVYGTLVTPINQYISRSHLLQSVFPVHLPTFVFLFCQKEQ